MDSKKTMIHYRTRNRIRKLGEVFTGESFINQMLELLDNGKQEFWSDESKIFFEPTCGHGNIVVTIFNRRLNAFHQKYISNGSSVAPFYAVANSINTLWAIDIDETNIEHCRARVLNCALEFIKSKLGKITTLLLIKNNTDYIAHLLCAIKWQIHENETLSCLSDEKASKANSLKTKTGAKWLSKNFYNPIDFNFSWISYFSQCQKDKSHPLELERAIKFLSGIKLSSQKGYSDFNFAKNILIEADITTSCKAKKLAVGY